MPIEKCTLSGGGKGFKAGPTGKCFANRNDAVKQLQAIKTSQKSSEQQPSNRSLLEKMSKILDSHVDGKRQSGYNSEYSSEYSSEDGSDHGDKPKTQPKKKKKKNIKKKTSGDNHESFK